MMLWGQFFGPKAGDPPDREHHLERSDPGQQPRHPALPHLAAERPAADQHLQRHPATLQLGAGEMLPAMERLLIGLMPGTTTSSNWRQTKPSAPIATS